MIKRTIGLVVICLLLAAPLAAVKKETQMVIDELQKLQELFSSLETKLVGDLAAMQKKLDTMDERLAAISKNSADMAQNHESITLNLQFFKEELNDIKSTLERLSDRLVNMQGPAADKKEPQAPATQPQPGSAIKDPAFSSDADAGYLIAFSDYNNSKYGLAIEGFQQYIKQFPDSSKVENALYWIGECYYAQKKFIDAINTFTDLLNRYKQGGKVVAAMLKKGYALVELGRQKEGAAALKDLVSRYPFSEEAKLAKQKLKELAE